MSFGKLLYKINPETRKIIRKLETTKKKIVKRQWSNIFIKKCLDVKVQPKHYNIYIYIYTQVLHPPLTSSRHTLKEEHLCERRGEW